MGTRHQRCTLSNMPASRRALALVVFATFLALLPAPAHAQTGCATEASWGHPDEAAAAEVLVLVNAHRATRGLPALETAPALMDAARWKAAHMAATGHFAHDDPDRSWQQRIVDCGYAARATENIGWGYPTPLHAVTGWLGSPGHRAHIEDPEAVVTGIAMVIATDGSPYWVQVFGTARAAAEPREDAPQSGTETPATGSGREGLSPPDADTPGSEGDAFPLPGELVELDPLPWVERVRHALRLIRL